MAVPRSERSHTRSDVTASLSAIGASHEEDRLIRRPGSRQPSFPSLPKSPTSWLQRMEPLNVSYRMQRTATLAQEVLERAKTRKLNWPLPSRFQRRTFREGDDEDAYFAATFASVAEHMGHISAECENYYCCVPPFQFKECEIAHIFRYHSRQASEKLLKTFENEESKRDPIVEEPGCPDTESVALVPAKTSDPKDIYVEVFPGTYRVSACLQEDTIKQTHLVKIKPGESVNLTFDL